MGEKSVRKLMNVFVSVFTVPYTVFQHKKIIDTDYRHSGQLILANFQNSSRLRDKYPKNEQRRKLSVSIFIVRTLWNEKA